MTAELRPEDGVIGDFRLELVQERDRIVRHTVGDAGPFL
jgi:hypothetical protein